MEQLNLFDDPVPQDPNTYLEGVKIMLTRMDTNPEEFSLTEGTWYELLRELFAHPRGEYGGLSAALTPEEVKAVTDKYREITRTNFTSKVLRILTKAAE